jgi:ATP-dependent 26S proteasome regulatory subunit
MAETEEARRDAAMVDYRKKLMAHKEVDAKVRGLRESVKTLKKDYDKTEDDLKALQSVGQIIGEVLRQLDEERCKGPSRTPDLPLPRVYSLYFSVLVVRNKFLIGCLRYKYTFELTAFPERQRSYELL